MGQTEDRWWGGGASPAGSFMGRRVALDLMTAEESCEEAICVFLPPPGLEQWGLKDRRLLLQPGVGV